tara:strand:- start:522 stop:1646 length:1125 start_codon:yes stop_codon:yes gene_type:complete
MNMTNTLTSRLLFVLLISIFSLSQAQIDPITAQITSASVSANPPSGRASFVGNALLYGSTLYGPGLISLLELDSNKQKVGLEMLIASTSFLGAMHSTKKYQLDYTHTRLMMWGAYAGTAYGLGSLVFFNSADTKKWAIPSMLLTPIGLVFARQLTKGRFYSEGETDLLISSGLMGILYGAGSVYLIPPVEKLSEATKGRLYVSSVMMTVPLTVWQTNQLINQFNLHQINRGAAALYTMNGIIGALYGTGLCHILMNQKYPRFHSLSAMLGLPVGICSAYQLHKNNSYTIGRTTLLGLGAIAGAVFSNGLTFLFEFEDSRIFAAFGIIGSTIGFYLVHNATQPNSNKVVSGEKQVSNESDQIQNNTIPIQLSFRF